MSCFKEATLPQLKRWALSRNVSGNKKHDFLADKVMNPCMVPYNLSLRALAGSVEIWGLPLSLFLGIVSHAGHLMKMLNGWSILRGFKTWVELALLITNFRPFSLIFEILYPVFLSLEHYWICMQMFRVQIMLWPLTAGRVFCGHKFNSTTISKWLTTCPLHVLCSARDSLKIGLCHVLTRVLNFSYHQFFVFRRKCCLCIDSSWPFWSARRFQCYPSLGLHRQQPSILGLGCCRWRQPPWHNHCPKTWE